MANVTKPVESGHEVDRRPPEPDPGPERSELRRIGKHFLRTPAVMVAALFLVLLVVMALAAPALAPHDPLAQDLTGLAFKPPAFSAGGSWAYPLGTDSLGRDILSRIIYGTRVSLSIGAVAVIFSGVLGIALGIIAGYYGGWIDMVIMRIADAQLAFPFILLTIAVMSVLGAGLRNIILVLGVTGWVVYARVVRGNVLVVKQQDYIQAARTLGAGDLRILVRHVLPNVFGTNIVLGTFAFAQFILTEAALSFLGLGVQPPTPTWGGILADGRDYMATAWWIATFPGIAIMLTVLAVNVLGDWLRDMLDPSLRGQ